MFVPILTCMVQVTVESTRALLVLQANGTYFFRFTSFEAFWYSTVLVLDRENYSSVLVLALVQVRSRI